MVYESCNAYESEGYYSDKGDCFDIKKEYENVNTLDGAKATFDDGWVLIRCSNTSPKIRLYVEATTQERSKELEDKFSKTLEEEISK